MSRWDYLPEHLESRVTDTFENKKKPVNSPNRATKYGNRKTIVDGITFDSAFEAGYYQSLCLLKKANVIKDFELQVKLELQPAFKKDGKRIRAINYIADFKVIENDDHAYYVDTKGFRTQLYSLKKKMLLFKYPDIDFREVSDG